MYVLTISECEDSGPSNKKWILVSSEQQQQKTVLNVLKKIKKIIKKKASKGMKVACSPICAFCAFLCVKFSHKKQRSLKFF